MIFLSKLKELWRGKDVYRIFMNEECEKHTLKGKVVDIGSGTTLASYHRFLHREPGVELECLDLGFDGNSSGTQKRIDLESDQLPYADASVDTVLLFNVLEHIFNYEHLIQEIKRILKPGGQLLGVVPFLVAYHPDPHDYWRYTNETLQFIFLKSSFSKITISPFGYGPYMAGFSQTEMVIPRLLKVLILPIIVGIDSIILRLRPKMGKHKFYLGLFFSIEK